MHFWITLEILARYCKRMHLIGSSVGQILGYIWFYFFWFSKNEISKFSLEKHFSRYSYINFKIMSILKWRTIYSKNCHFIIWRNFDLSRIFLAFRTENGDKFIVNFRNWKYRKLTWNWGGMVFWVTVYCVPCVVKFATCIMKLTAYRKPIWISVNLANKYLLFNFLLDFLYKNFAYYSGITFVNKVDNHYTNKQCKPGHNYIENFAK